MAAPTTITSSRSGAAIQKYYNYLQLRDATSAQFKGIAFGTGGDALMSWDGTRMRGPNPSSGLWNLIPSLAYGDPTILYKFEEDFTKLAIDNTTANPTEWTYTGDADGDVTLKTGEFGGVLNIQTGATDNNETTIQIGTGSTGTIVEITDSNSKPVWFICRVKALQATDEAVFIGLAEEGVGANFLTDNTGVPADVDYIGFRYKTDVPAAWDVAWRLSGQAEQEIAAAAVNAADWHTFGFYFDGASTVTFYIDGTASATTATTSAATFPSGEEMSPVIAIKTGANATYQADVDYIFMYGVR